MSGRKVVIPCPNRSHSRQVTSRLSSEKDHFHRTKPMSHCIQVHQLTISQQVRRYSCSSIQRKSRTSCNDKNHYYQADISHKYLFSKSTWFDLNRFNLIIPGPFGVWKSIVTGMVTKVLDSTIGISNQWFCYVGKLELLFDESWLSFRRVVLYDVGFESREQVESSDQSLGLFWPPGLCGWRCCLVKNSCFSRKGWEDEKGKEKAWKSRHLVHHQHSWQIGIWWLNHMICSNL